MTGGATARPARADEGGSLTIGALAERTGVTVETIRYYERVRVLPLPNRQVTGPTHAGYRRYGPADVSRLAFVCRARELGFSLDEVRQLLSLAGDPERPCAEVDALARAHLAKVDAKLAELAALRRELGRVISKCRGGVDVAECRILGALGGPAIGAAGAVGRHGGAG